MTQQEADLEALRRMRWPEDWGPVPAPAVRKTITYAAHRLRIAWGELFKVMWPWN